jgi:hypothetical protein
MSAFAPLGPFKESQCFLWSLIAFLATPMKMLLADSGPMNSVLIPV